MSYRYFKTITINDSNILLWESKELSHESIKRLSTSNKMLNSSSNYGDTKARVKFNGDCLKQKKNSFDHEKTINYYIVYIIDRFVNISSYSILEDSVFGAVELTRYVDFHLYNYAGYCIGFDKK